jgi:hypothetical protein
VTTWDARTVVSAVRSTTWNVLGALIPVTTSVSTTWNVLTDLASVSATRATTWLTKAIVAATRSTTWQVEGPVVEPTFTINFPTYRVPLGTVEPLKRMWFDAPKALVKANGEWLEVAVPSQELLRVAEKFYLGGYQHQLTAEEAADLPPQYVEEIL